MNPATDPLSLFEAVSGTILFLSFLIAVFCIASLRSHVDESKLRQEKNISALFKSPIPPEHILTPVGLGRVKAAKIAIAVGVVTLAVIILRVHVFSG